MTACSLLINRAGRVIGPMVGKLACESFAAFRCTSVAVPPDLAVVLAFLDVPESATHERARVIIPPMNPCDSDTDCGLLHRLDILDVALTTGADATLFDRMYPICHAKIEQLQSYSRLHENSSNSVRTPLVFLVFSTRSNSLERV